MIRELENSKILRFIYGGPKITFHGTFSNKTYRAGGDDEIEVFEEDVEYLLSKSKRGRKYFALVEETMVAGAEQYDVGIDYGVSKDFTVIVEVVADEDLDNAIDLMDDFTSLNGVGRSLDTKLHNEGVHTLEDLYLKGEEWISNLSRVSKDKAKDIYEQIKEELKKYDY